MSDYKMQEYRTPQFDNAQVMIMEEVPDYTTEDYDLFNEKDFKKYIDDVEKMVRSSREYREAVQYMRKYMDMNTSAFSKNINNIESNKIKIELHHTPFTLYDIALAVFNKRSRLGEPLDIELVAKEVAYIHYLLIVGLIPLSKTEHKLVHNQALFVPVDKVLGNYEKFIDMYEKDIPEDAMARYNTYVELTKNYNHQDNTKVLEVSPTYLKLPGSDEQSLGAYSLPLLQDVLAATQNTLKTLTQRTPQAIESNKYDNNQKMIKPFTVGILEEETK